MADFTDSITGMKIDLATLTDRDLAELQTMTAWEINRRLTIAGGPVKLAALFAEYEAAGGDRGLLLDAVDPTIRAPLAAEAAPPVEEPL